MLAGANTAAAEALERVKVSAEHARAILPDGLKRFRIEAGNYDTCVYYRSACLAVRFYQQFTNVPDGKLIVLYSRRKGPWYKEDWDRYSSDAFPLEYSEEHGLHWRVDGRAMGALELGEKLIVELVEIGDRFKPEEE